MEFPERLSIFFMGKESEQKSFPKDEVHQNLVTLSLY